MPETNHGAPPAARDENDPLEVWRAELAEARQTLARQHAKKPFTVEGLFAVMDGTVLALMDRLGELTLERTDAIAEYFENKLEEGDGTQLLPEDAEKLTKLAAFTKALIESVRESARASGAALDASTQKNLAEGEVLANECLELIEESTLEDDDEGPDGDDEEDDEEDEDDGPNGAVRQ